MKWQILILLFSLQIIAFSQKDSIIIKGIVISNEQKKVQNAYVHLISSQDHRYEYKTDSTGKYRFWFFTDAAFTCTVTIASDKHTISRKYRNLGFLATRDNAIFELQPGKSYEKNFELTAIPFCGPVAPTIFFYKNSTTSFNDSLHKKDSAFYESFQNTIDELYFTLQEEPSIIIEIGGHASSNEKDPDQISLARATRIKNLLVKKGIHADRIYTKAYGNKKLFLNNKVIARAKTKEERECIHLKNQRVIFRIISWDAVKTSNEELPDIEEK